MGGFLYIECLDYPHYATFDVDFYASFVLLELFPELERRLIVDYAHAVSVEDLRPHPIMWSGETVPRKLIGAVPHDLGGPYENPWLDINNYTFQNINRWKDLNAKFVLRLYRDAILLNDPSLITDYWREVRMAMEYLGAMDYDEDGIPENEGIPDQTYDTWPVTGVSAYSGSLWLAALTAGREMANMVGDSEVATQYGTRLEQATQVYEATLWNGEYYQYDASDSPYHDSIMSDQLAGQWYLEYFGMGILPEDHVEDGAAHHLPHERAWLRRWGHGCGQWDASLTEASTRATSRVRRCGRARRIVWRRLCSCAGWTTKHGQPHTASTV